MSQRRSLALSVALNANLPGLAAFGALAEGDGFEHKGFDSRLVSYRLAVIVLPVARRRSHP